MCDRDDIEPPRKKLFCDQFECLNVKFVNIMLILPKFRGVHKKCKNFNKFYHIYSPYVCRTHFLHNFKVKIQNISKFVFKINKKYISIV